MEREQRGARATRHERAGRRRSSAKSNSAFTACTITFTTCGPAGEQAKSDTSIMCDAKAIGIQSAP
jgi:hypothetical protein